MSRYTTTDQVAVESRRVEKVYSTMARVYDGFFDWALGPGRRLAVARLPLRPGNRVLEVGVGTGLSLPLYPAGIHLTGIDISEAMLEQARLRRDSVGLINVDLRRMDAMSLSFGDETFDHVLAPYLISVVPEPLRVMAEMRRVCKPGGTVVVVNHFLSPNPILGSLERAFTPLSRWIGFRMDLPLDEIVPMSGLEVQSVQRVNLLGMWRLLVMRRID
jgi:phosphatidylethanolamine/phosphatidyl-N-methylethanolamine N-methyltransferase